MSFLDHQKCFPILNSDFFAHGRTGARAGGQVGKNSRAVHGHGNECLELSSDWSEARRCRSVAAQSDRGRRHTLLR